MTLSMIAGCSNAEEDDSSFPGGTRPCGLEAPVDMSTCGDGVHQPGELCLAEPVTVATGSSTEILGEFFVADLDEDDDLDVVIDADFDVLVLLGDGAGGFAASKYRWDGAETTLRALADFDGDGDLDMLVHWSGAEGPRDGFLVGDGQGGFASGSEVTLATDGGDAVAADFDGDGLVDIASAAGGHSLDDPVQVGVLRGLPDGTYVPAAQDWEAGAGSRTCRAADLDGDQRQDLLLSSGLSSGKTEAAVMFGDGEGMLLDPVGFGRSGSPLESDMNADGVLDIVLSPRVAHGAGDRAFAEPVETELLSCGADSVADMNLDERADVVVVVSPVGGDSYEHWDLAVLLGDGMGGVQGVLRAGEVGGQAQLGSYAIADFNGDGLPDVVSSFTAGEIAIFLSNP
jgi:hypothetical protein